MDGYSENDLAAIEHEERVVEKMDAYFAHAIKKATDERGRNIGDGEAWNYWAGVVDGLWAARTEWQEITDGT